MADPIERISDPGLSEALQRIRGMMGSMVSSRELRASIPGFKTQKGIYKPQSSEYALWIRQTVNGPYPDLNVDTLPDGSWLYRYTPEARGGITDLDLSTNKALINSMKDRIPVGVFIQKEVPGSGSTYEVEGLAYVEKFDGTYFMMHGEPIDIELEPMLSSNIKPFQPFDRNEIKLSQSLKAIRDRAFQTAVRRVYHGKCSLCELGFTFKGQPLGVEAAHLIPVSDRGTSADVRNGILLCRNHHSLFDRYLWTFDEDYRVIVSEDHIFRESAKENHILKVEGRKLPNLPDKEYDFPATAAIDFRMDKFNDPESFP